MEASRTLVNDALSTLFAVSRQVPEELAVKMDVEIDGLCACAGINIEEVVEAYLTG